jgi:CheY-like chemotaxis protein
MDYSQKAEVSRKPVDLNLVVENAVDVIERTFPKIIEIDASYAEDLAVVDADALKVEQTLMNVCINAKEAMPDGGTIRIVTRNVLVDEDFCKKHDGTRFGRFVLIEITDTGMGMDPKIASRIFDPFFTTKGWDSTKGTGLGLSVAKGIVEQHGGWISCESELGKGTRFAVYFPTVEASHFPFTAQPVGVGSTAKGKILLVDDEELLRELAKRFLWRAGYTVITAANGIEALEIFRREQADIALVVLDLIMPRMAGEKCLEELLSINPELKVIVSSGHSLSRQERSRLGVLAKGFANKPYELKQLLQIVKEVMAKP